jgi:hypothetical protein
MLKRRMNKADINTLPELGHTRKGCTEEQREVEKVNIMCSNCNEEGHRMRDCQQERKTRGGAKTCKNCGQEGHIAKECDQPRSAENVECKNCGESRSSPPRRLKDLLTFSQLGISVEIVHPRLQTSAATVAKKVTARWIARMSV